MTINTTPQQILPARHPHQRGWLTLQLSDEQTQPVYIGVDNATVTSNSGLIIKPGDMMTIENTTLTKPASKAIYACTAAGTADLIVVEGT